MPKSNPSLVVRRWSLAADVPLIPISLRTGKATFRSCRKKPCRKQVATSAPFIFPRLVSVFDQRPTTDDGASAPLLLHLWFAYLTEIFLRRSNEKQREFFVKRFPQTEMFCASMTLCRS